MRCRCRGLMEGLGLFGVGGLGFRVCSAGLEGFSAPPKIQLPFLALFSANGLP